MSSLDDVLASSAVVTDEEGRAVFGRAETPTGPINYVRIQDAAKALKAVGLSVLYPGRHTISVHGPTETYAKIFGYVPVAPATIIVDATVSPEAAALAPYIAGFEFATKPISF